MLPLLTCICRNRYNTAVVSCGTDCLNISEMPSTLTYANAYANLGFCHNVIVTDFYKCVPSFF